VALHFIRARPLGEELAKDAVSAREQASYFAASFILWLLPGYLLLVPPPNFAAWSIPMGLWLYEGFALVLLYYFGVLYCLGKCRVNPRRHFIIDFSCLYTPISLTTLLLVWGLFYVYAALIPWLLQHLSFDSRPYVIEFLYSARFFDLMRFAAVVGVTFIVLARIGRHMQRISELRMSAMPSSSVVTRDG
jgi:hypothetical protein